MSNPAEKIHHALNLRIKQVQNCVHDMRVASYNGPVPKFLPKVPETLYPKVLILSPSTFAETLHHPTAQQVYDPYTRKYMGLQVIISPEIPTGEVVIL